MRKFELRHLFNGQRLEDDTRINALFTYLKEKSIDRIWTSYEGMVYEIYFGYVFMQHDYQSVSNKQHPHYQFNSHYDCVYAGYAIAQRTYKNLLEYEEDFDIDRLNREKLVVKFECRSVNNV